MRFRRNTTPGHHSTYLVIPERLRTLSDLFVTLRTVGTRVCLAFADDIEHLALEITLNFIKTNTLLSQVHDALTKHFVAFLTEKDFLVEPVLIFLHGPKFFR